MLLFVQCLFKALYVWTLVCSKVLKKCQWCFIDVWSKNPFKIDQQTTCKMECLILPPFEAPLHPTIASGPQNAPMMSPRRPKDDLLAPQHAPKTSQKRLQDASKTAPMPSGWSQLCPAAPKAAKNPPRPRFLTLQTSIWNPPDFDFRPSSPRCWFSNIDFGNVNINSM